MNAADLIQARKALGLSQEMLARKAGIATPTLARFESRQTKTLQEETLKKVMAVIYGAADVPIVSSPEAHLRGLASELESIAQLLRNPAIETKVKEKFFATFVSAYVSAVNGEFAVKIYPSDNPDATHREPSSSDIKPANTADKYSFSASKKK